MIDPTTPPPSRLLKTVAGLARWSLRLLLAFWLLLAIIWGVLHGAIVPRIGDFRPQLEAYAARTLGVAVRIGAVAAATEGLVLSIGLSDVTLLDAAGRPALRLPRVVLALSARSLLEAGVEQLFIDRPELEIRRTSDGRIQVAGLEFAHDGSGRSAAADWLFAQREVFIQGGTVRWSDEQRQAPVLALSQVDLVLRNGNWQHLMRLDATPPPAWGDRFTLVGRLRASLLHARDSNWRYWNGQLFADFARVDVSQLRHHADLGANVEVARGRGALRAWADVRDGQIVGGTADLALADVATTLGPGLPALVLPSIQGRLGGQRLAEGFEFFAEALQFQTDDGLRWPGGNLRLLHSAASGALPEQGELRADRLDLAVLAQIASRLPLGATVHEAVRSHAPQGLVDQIEARWKGPLDGLRQYRLQASIRGLALAAGAPGAAPSHPGLRGAMVSMSMTETGGRAALRITSGALVLPGVWEDPVLPLDRLSADVYWQIQGQRIAVQARQVQFANADAQGQAQISWHTGAARRARFPGVLDLTGSLSRADGARVHRYLPLAIEPSARHYVRQAVIAGSASQVQFRVKGDLHELPFNDPRQGEFRIAARVKDVTYAYVPPALQPAGAGLWPALTQLGGELIFERSGMQVRGASGRLAGSRGLQLSMVEARIPDLEHTVVAVSAEAHGPLPELLRFVNDSPLAGITDNALAHTSGSGNAGVQLSLSLPIGQMQLSKVQGSVTLADNDVRITPDLPPLGRVRGMVQFSETGFALSNLQAQALGGTVRLEGGMRALAANAPASESALQIRAQGSASAEGLQQTPQLGLLSRLARRASGSTAYTLALTQRRGVPEWQLSSSLQGLALALPAPLGKPADSSLPLRFDTRVARESLSGLANAGAAPPLRELITLDLGTVGSASYLQDLSGPQARVLRGAIGIGLAPGEAAPQPAQGVAAHMRFDQGRLDVDAWRAVLAQATEPSAHGATPGLAQAWLPTTLALRARALTLQGRTLHNLVARVQREGATWRANLHASELEGYLEYRPPGGSTEYADGLVFARLARARMPPSEVAQAQSRVGTLPDAQPGQSGQSGQSGPSGNLPALDIVVEDFELRGKRLGQLEMQACNQGTDGDAGLQREWRLTRFNLLTPEASLSAQGNWARLNATGPGAGPRPAERRTALSFELDIRDSGALLERLGLAHVVRHGKGLLQGRVAWLGAPFNPDYRSMTGQTHLNIESGQFLKADPGLAKLLGVLSLQSLPRRLTLDFRDVFSEGFAFDFVRGDLRIEQGVASTNNLQMKGVNAAVLMEGSADIAHETQNLRVVVVPEIDAMTASLVATAINPMLGLGSFLAQMFLRGPLIEAATKEFHIDGSWADPQVVRVPRQGRQGHPVTDASPAGSSASPSGSDPRPSDGNTGPAGSDIRPASPPAPAGAPS